MKALFKWENGSQEYLEVPSYPPPVMEVPLMTKLSVFISDTVPTPFPGIKRVKFLRVNHNDGSFEYKEFIQ